MPQTTTPLAIFYNYFNNPPLIVHLKQQITNMNEELLSKEFGKESQPQTETNVGVLLKIPPNGV